MPVHTVRLVPNRPGARSALTQRRGLAQRWGLDRRPGLVSAVLVAAAAATLATPLVPAEAHGALASSRPAAGSQISTPITKVRLTFETPINSTPAVVTLTIDGAAPRPLTTTAQPQGLTALIPADITADRSRVTASQAWTITYRITAEDGHSISDQLTFTMTAPPTSTTPTSTTQPSTTQPSAAATGTPDPAPTTAPARPRSSPSPILPHQNGVNPHGTIGPDRLLVPGLAVGLIAIAALLVVVGPRLRTPRSRRKTPTQTALTIPPTTRKQLIRRRPLRRNEPRGPS